MSFSRRRAPGLFIDGSVITGAEFEYWDAAIGSAFDPVGGGAYALEANVAIGGAPGVYWQFDLGVTFADGIEVHNLLEVYGNAGLYGNTTIGSGPADVLSVQSVATFADYAHFLEIAEFEGTTYFNGTLSGVGEAHFHSNVSFDGGVVVVGASGADGLTVNAFTQFNDILIANGSAYFNGAVSLGDAVTDTTYVAGTLKFTGGGAIAQRTAVGSDADMSYSPRAVKDVVILDGGLSGPRAYTIDDTNCVDNNEITFINKDQTHALQVRSPIGVNLGTNVGHWFRCKRIGGTWMLLEEGSARA